MNSSVTRTLLFEFWKNTDEYAGPVNQYRAWPRSLTPRPRPISPACRMAWPSASGQRPARRRAAFMAALRGLPRPPSARH